MLALSDGRAIAAAYKTLRDHSDGVFPVSPLQIAQSMGITVASKYDLMELFHYIGRPEAIAEKSAFTVFCGGRQIVALDPCAGTEVSRRLWLAHEIGHIVIGEPDGAWENAGRSRRRSMVDHCCDVFAQTLLAPPKVLALGGVRSALEISRVCMVPPSVASITAYRVRNESQNLGVSTFEVWAAMACGLRDRRRHVASNWVPGADDWFLHEFAVEFA